MVQPGVMDSTVQLDARIELLASARPLKHAAPVHLHLGTAETTARVYLLGATGRRSAVQPGRSCLVQLRLANPLTAVLGDRFILRQFSPLITIAGGTVLHPSAERHRKGDGSRQILEVLETGSRGEVLSGLCHSRPFGIGGRDLTSLTGRPGGEWEGIASRETGLCVVRKSPLWVCSLMRIAEHETKLVDAVARYHRANPLESGPPAEELRNAEFAGAPPFYGEFILQRLVSEGILVTDGELVRTADHSVRMDGDDARARDDLTNILDQAGLEVPALKELVPDLPTDSDRCEKIVAALLREGVLVRVNSEFVFHRSAIDSLLSDLKPLRGATIDVPGFKQLAGVSRKYAIPLLEYFDRVKVTLRIGNLRRVL